jgi:hypothetical protein
VLSPLCHSRLHHFRQGWVSQKSLRAESDFGHNSDIIPHMVKYTNNYFVTIFAIVRET